VAYSAVLRYDGSKLAGGAAMGCPGCQGSAVPVLTSLSHRLPSPTMSWQAPRECPSSAIDLREQRLHYCYLVQKEWSADGRRVDGPWLVNERGPYQAPSNGRPRGGGLEDRERHKHSSWADQSRWWPLWSLKPISYTRPWRRFVYVYYTTLRLSSVAVLNIARSPLSRHPCHYGPVH